MSLWDFLFDNELRRESCIYCGQHQPEARQSPEAAASSSRLIRCVRCYNEVREDRAHFSPEGLLCDACHENSAD